MKRYSYRERDYAFGQAMMTLRTSIGLTQAGLADLLGVSRRADARGYRLGVHTGFYTRWRHPGQRELEWHRQVVGRGKPPRA